MNSYRGSHAERDIAYIREILLCAQVLSSSIKFKRRNFYSPATDTRQINFECPNQVNSYGSEPSVLTEERLCIGALNPVYIYVIRTKDLAL